MIISAAIAFMWASFFLGMKLNIALFFIFVFVGGFVVNPLALLVALVVIIAIAIGLPRGTAGATVKRHWLGLANGAVVMASLCFFHVT